jgi:O-antigen ligase
VWKLANNVLGTHASGTISLEPWRTVTEIMKLTTYAMAAWLARVFANRIERANILSNAIIFIGALYALYALILKSMNTSQFDLLYGMHSQFHYVSGPFVSRDNYATYAGLITLCCGVKLVNAGRSAIAPAKGFRQSTLALLQYLFGAGVFYLAAAALTLSTIIATGSRAGTFATIIAITSLLALSAAIGARQVGAGWVGGVGLAILAGIIVLFAMNGEFLTTRLNDLATLGWSDKTRQLLSAAALRMISNAPFLGLGLGTYQNAYPLYSNEMTRFVMDKAHNDYLELAAGWGLAAAAMWWSALIWLLGICARGVYIRRRNRLYPMLAIGASILVGAHSIFDFGLQIPAISLTYAAILGLGVSQAFSTREKPDELRNVSLR